MARGSSLGDDDEEREDLMSSDNDDDLPELTEDERWQRTYQQLLDLADELIDLAREEPDQEVEAPPAEDLASGLEELGLPPKNQQELQVFIEFLDSACKEKSVSLEEFLGKLRGGGAVASASASSASASAAASGPTPSTPSGIGSGSGHPRNLPPLPTTPNVPSGGGSRWPAGDVDLDAAEKEEERRSRRSSLADPPEASRSNVAHGQHLNSANSLPSSTRGEHHANSAASLPGSTRAVFPNAGSYVAAPPIGEMQTSPGVTSIPMSDLAESRRPSITPSEPLASPREPAWLTSEELQRLAEWPLPTMPTSPSANACEDLHHLLQETKLQVSSLHELVPGGPLQRVLRKYSEALERAQTLSIRGAEELEGLVNAVGRHQEEASRHEARVKKVRDDLCQVEDRLRQSSEESQQQEDVARKLRAEVEAFKKDLADKRADLSKSASANQRLETEQQELQELLKQKEAECTAHAADVTRLREELSQESSKHEQDAPELMRLRAEVEALKKDLEEKRADLSKSASASQRLEAEQQHLQELLKQKQADCESRDEDIRRLQGELGAHVGSSTELVRLQDEVSKQRALVEEEEAQRRALEATLQEERAAASEALLKGRSDALLEQEASAKACEELKAALAKAQQDCQQAEAALSKENDDRRQHESAAQDVHRMADKLRNAGVENDRLERKVALQEASLETRLTQLAASQLRERFARRRRCGRGMEATLTPRGGEEPREAENAHQGTGPDPGALSHVVESPLAR